MKMRHRYLHLMSTVDSVVEYQKSFCRMLQSAPASIYVPLLTDKRPRVVEFHTSVDRSGLSFVEVWFISECLVRVIDISMVHVHHIHHLNGTHLSASQTLSINLNCHMTNSLS